MDDTEVWSFERCLWIGDAEHFRAAVDDNCLMVVPFPPFVMSASHIAEATTDTPRWREVDFERGRISRPQEDVVVLAYRAKARRGAGEHYEAWCTSTYRRLNAASWRIIQHQQTPLPEGDTMAL